MSLRGRLDAEGVGIQEEEDSVWLKG